MGCGRPQGRGCQSGPLELVYRVPLPAQVIGFGSVGVKGPHSNLRGAGLIPTEG